MLNPASALSACTLQLAPVGDFVTAPDLICLARICPVWLSHFLRTLRALKVRTDLWCILHLSSLPFVLFCEWCSVFLFGMKCLSNSAATRSKSFCCTSSAKLADNVCILRHDIYIRRPVWRAPNWQRKWWWKLKQPVYITSDTLSWCVCCRVAMHVCIYAPGGFVRRSKGNRGCFISRLYYSSICRQACVSITLSKKIKKYKNALTGILTSYKTI